jgi:hypothetical protein
MKLELVEVMFEQNLLQATSIHCHLDPPAGGERSLLELKLLQISPFGRNDKIRILNSCE